MPRSSETVDASNLRCVDRPVIDAALRDREQLLSAALTVATAEEIKRLFLEFQAAGVTFFQTLKRQPWGARNFIIQDPDGNCCCSQDRLNSSAARATADT